MNNLNKKSKVYPLAGKVWGGLFLLFALYSLIDSVVLLYESTAEVNVYGVMSAHDWSFWIMKLVVGFCLLYLAYKSFTTPYQK